MTTWGDGAVERVITPEGMCLRGGRLLTQQGGSVVRKQLQGFNVAPPGFEAPQCLGWGGSRWCQKRCQMNLISPVSVEGRAGALQRF